MLAKNLVRLRKKHGYTQKDMAELLNISPQAYHRYERTDEKRNEPSTENLSKLADVFKTSVDDLLGRKASETDYFEEAETLAFDLENVKDFNDLSPEAQERIRKSINEQLEFLVHKEKKDS